MTTCSELSLALGEPLHATASFARAWVLVEEPAPWGRKAVAEAGLGELEQRAKALGVRVGLVRRGRERSATGRRAFLVHCGPGRAFVEEAEAADAAALDDRTLERLAAGERPGLGAERPEPLYLVCTNGRRDVCCGRAGRDLVRALGPELGEQLWETSHIGGHRFAPNLVCLPHGLVYGRLDVDSARVVVQAYEARRLELDHLRGRSSLEPAEQAADVFVRRATGRVGLEDDPASELRVHVESEPLDPPRPESCDGEPKRPLAWRLVSLEPPRHEP